VQAFSPFSGVWQSSWLAKANPVYSLAYLQSIQWCVAEFMFSEGELGLQSGMPSACGRSLPCQPVRGANTQEERHWSHAWQRFKRSKGVKLNDILECKMLIKKEDRTLTDLEAEKYCLHCTSQSTFSVVTSSV
jgi:hypothetical protein